MKTKFKTPAANTGFASGGVRCKLGALCFYSSSVQVDSFVVASSAVLLIIIYHISIPPSIYYPH